MSNRPGRQPSAAPAARTGAGRRDKLSTPAKAAVLVLAGLAVAALVIAVTAGTDRDDSADTEIGVAQTAPVEVIGDPLPRYEGAQPDPAVGVMAPRVLGSGFDDAKHSIRPGDGRAKVIAFFAHWCPHCQRELPRLTAWLADNDLPAGVDLVAVNTAVADDRDNYPPSAWFETEGWTLPVLRDSPATEIAEGYGLSSFPYTVVLNGAGAVVARVSGELSTPQWETLLATAASAATTG